MPTPLETKEFYSIQWTEEVCWKLDAERNRLYREIAKLKAENKQLKDQIVKHE